MPADGILHWGTGLDLLCLTALVTVVIISHKGFHINFVPWSLFAQRKLLFHCRLYCLFVKLNVNVDEADLDVLPQEPIDEDDIISLQWEDIAHASTGICSVECRTCRCSTIRIL